MSTRSARAVGRRRSGSPGRGPTAGCRRNRRWLQLVLVAAALAAPGLPCASQAKAGAGAHPRDLESPDAGVALAALAERIARHPGEGAELRSALERRGRLWELFEHGPGRLPADRRSGVVLAAAELFVRQLRGSLEDLRLVGALAWALDAFPGRDPARAEEARALREAVLEPLRRRAAPDPSRFAWVEIPAGTFQMGGSSGDADERPAHEVALGGFRMLAHEVTNEQFRRLVPGHGEPPGDGGLPAVNVDWYRAYAFSAWLGGRLPTEAEWEYAARAGTRTRFWSGEREEDLARVGWYAGNAEGRLHRVAAMPPSPWGLHDLHGGAWEWVADWYADYPAGAQRDPWGPAAGRQRVFRGGSFWDGAGQARAGNRNRARPVFGFVYLGFRPVLPAAAVPAPG